MNRQKPNFGNLTTYHNKQNCLQFRAQTKKRHSHHPKPTGEPSTPCSQLGKTLDPQFKTFLHGKAQNRLPAATLSPKASLQTKSRTNSLRLGHTYLMRSSLCQCAFNRKNSHRQTRTQNSSFSEKIRSDQRKMSPRPIQPSFSTTQNRLKKTAKQKKQEAPMFLSQNDNIKQQENSKAKIKFYSQKYPSFTSAIQEDITVKTGLDLKEASYKNLAWLSPLPQSSNANIHLIEAQSSPKFTSALDSQFKASNIESNQTSKSESFRPDITSFELGLCQHQDSLSRSYPARHKSTGFLLTIKAYAKKQIEDNLTKFKQSLKKQCICNSLHIVQIYGVFADDQKLYVLKQYHEPYSMFLHVRQSKRGLGHDAVACMLDICQGVKELHSSRMLCTGLKTEDISYIHGTCKLFTLNHPCRQEEQGDSKTLTCPEVQQGQPYSKESDIWHLGLLFYEMLSGCQPFLGRSRLSKSTTIIDHLRLRLEQQRPKCIVNILAKMVATAPKQRPCIDRIIADLQFIQELAELQLNK